MRKIRRKEMAERKIKRTEKIRKEAKKAAAKMQAKNN